MGASSCTMCPPGFASVVGGIGGQGQACQMCPPGTIAPGNGSSTCSPCPMGSFSTTNASTACTVALPGYYAPEGAGAMLPCDAGSYGDTAGAFLGQCSGVCETGFACPPGSTSRTETSLFPQCISGYYLQDSANGTRNASCLECPPGTDCTAPGATLAELPVRQGFFRHSAESIDVRLCPDGRKTNSACKGAGGGTELCQPGTGGTSSTPWPAGASPGRTHCSRARPGCRRTSPRGSGSRRCGRCANTCRPGSSCTQPCRRCRHTCHLRSPCTSCPTRG